MNSTPTRRPPRFACAIACVSRSCSSRRFGRPVSASRVAMYCSRSSAWIRDDTSCTNDRIDAILPSASSSAEWYHSHQIVSPSLRLLRVRPVARGSSPLVSDCEHAGERLAVGLVQERRCPRCGMPSTSSATPAEDVLRLRRPAHEPEIAVPLEHRERRVADVRRQHPVRAAQRLLVVLLVVDVGVHGVDADDLAFAVAVRRVVDRLPARIARRLHQHLLGRDDLALQHAREQRLQLREALVADDLGDLAAGRGPCGSRPAIPRCGG